MTDGRQSFPTRTGALARVYEGLLYALAFVAVLLLLIMTASVSYEVVMRYFFDRPTQWVVEFSEYALLYMAFLPAAWVLRHEGHVRIDLAVRLLPRQLRRWLAVLVSLVGAGVSGVFFWFSAEVTLETLRSGEVLFRSVIVPKWMVLLAIPIGLSLLTLQFLVRAGRYARGTAEEEAELVAEI